MGGKSRKSGGVSKKLIERLVKGQNKTSNCGKPKKQLGPLFNEEKENDDSRLSSNSERDENNS